MANDELIEWREWARRLDTVSLNREEQLRRAAVQMPEETVAELGKLYTKAVAENQVDILNKLLPSIRNNLPDSDDSKKIRNLFNLMLEMGQYGHVPFIGRKLGELDPSRPDWSDLPKEMHFLVSPAEKYFRKYPYIYDEDTRDFIGKTASYQERDELTLIATEMKRVGYERVRQFARGLGRYSTEASMIRYLIGVLDALGLEYF